LEVSICEGCDGNGEREYTYDYHAIRLCRQCNGNGWMSNLPPFFSSTTIELAKALENDEDCSFALHDSLLDEHKLELAEHFAVPNEKHPMGCWAMDYILGQQ
jgi:hypothetical protein